MWYVHYFKEKDGIKMYTCTEYEDEDDLWFNFLPDQLFHEGNDRKLYISNIDEYIDEIEDGNDCSYVYKSTDACETWTINKEKDVRIYEKTFEVKFKD